MTSDDKNISHDLSFSDETLADEQQSDELTLEDSDYVEPRPDVPEIMGHLDDYPNEDVEDIDLEEVLEEESLSAPADDFGESESDFDEFPSDQEEWDNEEPGSYDEEFYGDIEQPEKSKKLKKGLAPVLILVAAVGVGAYLVMSPAYESPVAPPAPVPAEIAHQAQEPIPLQIPDMGQINEGLPQPVANINQIPRPPGEDDFLLPSVDMPQEVDIAAPVLPTEEGLPQLESANPLVEENVVIAEAAEATEVITDLPEISAGSDITEPVALQDDELSQTPEATIESVSLDNSAGTAEAIEGLPEDMGQSTAEDVSSVVLAETQPQPVEQGVETITEAPTTIAEPAVSDEFFPGVPEEREPSEQLTEPDLAQFPAVPKEGNEAPKHVVQVHAEEGESLSLPDISTSPVPGAETVQPDVYFDSRLSVPQGNVATLTNLPRKVDPTQEAGSKMVVVSKTASADDFEALVVAAGRALKLERYGAAADMYDSLYALNPRDPRVLMGQAVAYQNLGRTEGALKIYEELLEINPDNADALVNMLGILRQQYPEVALRRLMILQEKYPGKASISAQLGIMEADSGNFEEAMRYLGRAASIEPRNAQHAFNLAVIADRARKRDLAIKYYEDALEVDSVYGGGRSIPREQIYDRLAILRTRSQ